MVQSAPIHSPAVTRADPTPRTKAPARLSKLVKPSSFGTGASVGMKGCCTMVVGALVAACTMVVSCSSIICFSMLSTNLRILFPISKKRSLSPSVISMEDAACANPAAIVLAATTISLLTGGAAGAGLGVGV